MEKENSVSTKNGIAVHSYKNPNINSFYISLFVKAGSMYESAEENGITHFLEHALIRNVNSLMGDELYKTLDRCGMEFNASTYSEMVQIYLFGAKERFRTGAEIICKTLCPLVLSSADINTERERIKAEIRESDDRTSLSSFAANIIHEGTSLSRPILGSLGSVGRIGKNRLEAYRKSVFTKDNIFFYVTGNFTDEDISYLKECVGGCEIYIGENHSNLAPVPSNFGKRAPRVHIKNADFTMVRFNFDMDMEKIPYTSADLLYDVLLSGYNSRFFIEMSEKRGLFYDVTGSVEHYKNIGAFSFCYEVRGGSVYEAIESTLSILSDLKETCLPEDGCMKAGYVDNGNLLYDDARELNFTFAYDNHIMDNSYSSLEERSERYRRETPEQLRDAAREIFKPENLTLAIKGNKKKIDTARIDRLLKSWK